MDEEQIRARRLARQRERQARDRRRRLIVVGTLLVVVVAVAMIGLVATGGGATPSATSATTAARGAHHGAAGSASHTAHAKAFSASRLPKSTVTGVGTGKPGTATVPVLMYHVINPPPAGAPFPGLYVPSDEFAAQMQALKGAGWHAVTMDQLKAYWTRGVPLGPGKPIVLTFDNGYASQYENALPVLKRLGWVGNENIQLTGLPPSQGGLTDAQVRGLIAAGWELDTQGISHADLITLDASELQYQVATARQTVRPLRRDRDRRRQGRRIRGLDNRDPGLGERR